MKFLKKLKSSNFWISMLSAIMLIAQSVFNIEISSEHSSQIVLAILGVLVVSGIINDNNSNSEVPLKSGNFSIEVETLLDKINLTIKDCVASIVNCAKPNDAAVEPKNSTMKTVSLQPEVVVEQVAEQQSSNVAENVGIQVKDENINQTVNTVNVQDVITNVIQEVKQTNTVSQPTENEVIQTTSSLANEQSRDVL